MARSIWKYGVPMTDHFSLEMPSGAQLLSVQTQDSEPRLWALVADDAPRVPRRFAIYGTGWGLPVETHDRETYVGTFQMADGQLVWHLFDLGEDAP